MGSKLNMIEILKKTFCCPRISGIVEIVDVANLRNIHIAKIWEIVPACVHFALKINANMLSPNIKIVKKKGRLNAATLT